MPERYSTRAAYKSYIKNHIRPRWADTPMSALRPMAVEDLLKGLDLAPNFGAREKLVLPQFPCRSRGALGREGDCASDIR